MDQKKLKNFKELLKEYESAGFEIPYTELLLTVEWNDKRNQILLRDNHKCKMCGKIATENIDGMRNVNFLQIEHKNKLIYFDGEDFSEINDVTIEDVMLFSDKPYNLHVHHHYYVLNNQPWEYPDDALETLCNWCHWGFHELNRVPVFETNAKLKDLNFTPCYRCNGAGWFEMYEHVSGGVCFRCKGKRFEQLI